MCINLVIDFISNNNELNCKVWLYSIYNIDTMEIINGYGIDSMFNELNKYTNPRVYFHNLKYYSQFIISYLYNIGYKYNHSHKAKQEKSFNMLMNGDDIIYNINIVNKCHKYKSGNKYDNIYIYDSYKKLPYTIDDINNDFEININKPKSITVYKKREQNETASNDEINYLNYNVSVVGKALKHKLDSGFDKMTIGSDCMKSFKSLFTKNQFNTLFPVLDYNIDNDIRESYYGGWCYCEESLTNKDLGKGIVLDNNSIYAYVMNNYKFPIKEPIYFKGEYKEDEIYDLYVSRINVCLSLKRGKLPFIRLKNSLILEQDEYLVENDEPVELWLNNIDLELLYKTYDVNYLEFIDGYKFQSSSTLFQEYIQHWYNIKKVSKGAVRADAKAHLVNLYGKFGAKRINTNKYPVLNNEGILEFNKEKYNITIQDNYGTYETIETDYNISKGLYIPIASFITAYARRITIEAAQKAKDNGEFLYSDTDSVHILSNKLPEYLSIGNELGQWKIESKFDRARILGKKQYIESEMINGNWIDTIKCSGMANDAKFQANWDNFFYGFECENGYIPKRVKGGVIMIKQTFTLSE